MRYLSLIAVLAALIVSAAGGTIVWGNSASGTNTVVWGN
jgi:hypothetical protein